LFLSITSSSSRQETPEHAQTMENREKEIETKVEARMFNNF